MFIPVYWVTSTTGFYSKTLVSYAQRFQNKCISGQAYVDVIVTRREGTKHRSDSITWR